MPFDQELSFTFDEASTVFGDPLAVIFDDEEHSEDESREIIIGHSIRGRVVLVSFSERGEDIGWVIWREESNEKRAKRL